MLGWTVAATPGGAAGSHNCAGRACKDPWTPAPYLVVPSRQSWSPSLSLRAFFVPIRKMGIMGPACFHWESGGKD